MSDPGVGWERVCASAELLPGEQRVHWSGELPILLFNLDGALYALEDRCSHEDFELSQSEFERESASIECLLHGARFDIRDGRALCAPAYTPVRRFEAKFEADAVWVLRGAD